MACGGQPVRTRDAEEFQDSGHFAVVHYADLLESMTAAFPDLDRRVVRKIVYAYGKDPGHVVDELLKLDGDRAAGGGYEEDMGSQATCSAGSSRPFPLSGLLISESSKPAWLQASGMILNEMPRDPGDYNLAEFVSEKEMAKLRCEFIRGFLPDASPDFIQENVAKFGNDETKFQEWLQLMMVERKYPKLADYLKEKELSDLVKPLESMTASDFLDLFPDPAAHFRSTERIVTDVYKADVARLLEIVFRHAVARRAVALGDVLAKMNGLLLPCVLFVQDMLGMELEPRDLPTYRYFFVRGRPVDSTFVQEFTYLRLEPEIRKLLAVRASELAALVEDARKAGTLFTCPVCLDEEVLPFDVVGCSEGHGFCIKCVRKHAETCAKNSLAQVRCLYHGCPAVFALAELAGLLPSDVFGKLLKEEQDMELRSAGLEGLEECPFCPFRAVLDPTMTVFRCMNPKCRIDSCRKCKKRDHGLIPCRKVETTKQVEARVFLEEKLATAVIRTCPVCKKNVVKTDGCNHMVCKCGAHFCYRCRSPLTGHTPCMDQRCRSVIQPEVIHYDDMRQAAAAGRREIARNYGDLQLVHDPAKDLDQ